MYTNWIIVLSVVSPDSQSIFNEYDIDFNLSKVVFCSKRLRLSLSANCFQNTFVRLPTRRWKCLLTRSQVVLINLSVPNK